MILQVHLQAKIGMAGGDISAKRSFKKKIDGDLTEATNTLISSQRLFS
jgi:hypothetical protein